MKKLARTLMLISMSLILMPAIAIAQEKKGAELNVDEDIRIVNGKKVVHVVISKTENNTKTVIDTTFTADSDYNIDNILSKYSLNDKMDGSKKVVKVIEINEEKELSNEQKEEMDVDIIMDKEMEDLDKDIEIDTDEETEQEIEIIKIEDNDETDNKIIEEEIIEVKVIIDELSEEEYQTLVNNKLVSKKAKPINDVELEVSLNPSTGMLLIEFNLPDEGNTVFRISDINGKLILEEELDGFKGEYSKEINIGDSNKREYFLTVIQGKQVFTKKIVL